MSYPIIQQVGPGRYKPVKDFEFTVGKLLVTLRVDQRYDWLTDLGSIPKIFRNIIDPAADMEAFLIHDALYMLHLTSRYDADRRLLAALIENQNVENWRAWLVYYVVRAFGWVFWEKPLEVKQRAINACRIVALEA